MFALKLFGGLSLQHDGEAPLPPAALQRRRLALLALLAMSGERGVSRERVQAHLWPESSPERARHALDQLLYATRRDLGRDAVLSGPSDLRLNPAVVRPDTWAFDEAVRERRWADAVALYAGPLLDGVHLADDADFERLLDAERARLAAEHRRALDALATAAAERGDHVAAVEWWRKHAAADPLSARVALGLVRALAAARDPAGAVQHARLYGRLVRQELGMEPDPAVEAAAVALMEAPPAEAPLAEAAAVSLPEAPARTGPGPLGGEPAAMPAAAPAPQPTAGVRDEHPAPGATGAPRRTTRVPARLGRVAAVLVAAACLAAALLVHRRRPPEGAATTVAVLPFQASGGADAAHLAEGMTVLLSTNLNGAGELRGVDPHALLSYVARTGGGAADPALGAAVAENFGAGLYVLGDVVQVGPRLRIAAALYDRGQGDAERAVAQGTVEGTTAEFFTLVDRLTADLVAGRQRGPRARLTRLASVTTASWPALKAYLQGESAMRAGRFADAVVDFRRAVAEDTTFALAYYRLAVAANWSDASEPLEMLADRAVRHADRLSERDRTLLLAFRAEFLGDGEEAERLYRAILGRYPDDVETWFRLGEVLFHSAPLYGRPTTGSREAFERVLALDPRNGEAVVHLARIAALEGRHQAFDSLGARSRALAGPSAQAWETGVVRAVRHGTAEERRRLVAALREATDGRLYGAVRNAAIYGGDLAETRRLALLLADPARVAETRAVGHVLAAYVDVARGRLRAAQAELARAAALDELVALEYGSLLGAHPLLPPGARFLDAGRDSVRWRARLAAPRMAPHTATSMAVHDSVREPLRLYALGLAAARAGDSASAAGYARALDTAPAAAGRAPTLPRDLAHSVRAHLAYHAGRSAEALRELEAAPVRAAMENANFSPLYNRAHDRFLRAELLRAAGRDREALGWYASLGGDSFYDLPYVAPAARRLGELYQRLGDGTQARRHQARFVALWGEADAELQPAAAAARAR